MRNGKPPRPSGKAAPVQSNGANGLLLWVPQSTFCVAVRPWPSPEQGRSG